MNNTGAVPLFLKVNGAVNGAWWAFPGFQLGFFLTMEDLEDLSAGLRTSRLDDEAAASGVSSVLPKSGRPPKRSTDDEATLVPGTQTVYLKTQGCSHNVSDSEYMAGLLSCYGYRITEVFEEADV